MNYDTWKSIIEEKFNSSQYEKENTVLYFPKSQNFTPITDFMFRLDQDIYLSRSRRFMSIEDLEEFLENTNGVALYQVVIVNNSKDPIARFTILEKEKLKPVSLEEFLNTLPKNQKLNESNQNYGTIEGLQSQMEAINDLGQVFVLTSVAAKDTEQASIRIERFVSDGKWIYI